MKLLNLRAIRQRKALTQQELAERSGVNRVTIARLETGADDDPFPRTVRKLAEALEVQAEELSGPVDRAAATREWLDRVASNPSHYSGDPAALIEALEELRRLWSEPDAAN